MTSLSAHLRQAGDHSRLAFHPACPVCCDERLAGALPADALASRRSSALLLAGVFAFSSAVPAPVLAAEGDQDQVGTESSSVSAPGSGLNADPTDADDPPDGAGASEEAEVDDDTGPVGPDLVTEGDPEDSPVPSGSGVTAPSAAAAPAASEAPAKSTPAARPAPREKAKTGAAPGAKPPATAAPAVPDASAEAATGPSAAAPAAASAPAMTSPATPAASAPRDGNQRSPGRTRTTRRLLHRHPKTGAVVVRSAPAPQPAQVVATTRPSVTTAAYVAAQPSVARPAAVADRGRPARPGDRVHVVFGGESLWSISEDLLGGRATVAEVAQEVDRLWALNRERIGTGDRDLLPIGTRLVLR